VVLDNQILRVVECGIIMVVKEEDIPQVNSSGDYDIRAYARIII
jgi:hypothetical protein